MDLTIGGSTFEHIETAGPERVAASAFDVDGLLADTARFAMGSIDGLGAQGGLAPPERLIDREPLLTYCTTHVEMARLGSTPDRASVAAAIAERDAFELEGELVADGMIGAAVRTPDEWDAHPHAVATRDLPLMSADRIGDAAPQPAGSSTDGPDDSLAGVRVLDCSRVLAGPVAGQMLAGFGADVLRVGADHRPSVHVGVIATGFGKRNTSIDLRTDDGRMTMEALISEADVWIDVYRPGALASHGFTPERVAELRAGIVIVQICAFDWTGPWAGRRGFDSIVQSTTGVRWAGGEFGHDSDGRPTGTPTGLPVQALDYATGFLAAGLVAQLVAHQRDVGGSWLGRTSLLRLRNDLVARRSLATFFAEPLGTAAPTW
jgi:crotonobetainyl-CoA:carnitine CoA-transferase CaiB-like acyl-CoA transferase